MLLYPFLSVVRHSLKTDKNVTLARKVFSLKFVYSLRCLEQVPDSATGVCVRWIHVLYVPSGLRC